MKELNSDFIRRIQWYHPQGICPAVCFLESGEDGFSVVDDSFRWRHGWTKDGRFVFSGIRLRNGGVLSFNGQVKTGNAGYHLLLFLKSLIGHLKRIEKVIRVFYAGLEQNNWLDAFKSAAASAWLDGCPPPELGKKVGLALLARHTDAIYDKIQAPPGLPPLSHEDERKLGELLDSTVAEIDNITRRVPLLLGGV